MGISPENNVKGNDRLGAFSLWAIGVSLVISGESFGWNIGWGYTGPLFFFIPVAISAIMYYALVHCLIELACVYPEASGPHEYIRLAFGKNWATFISLAVLFEFLFAAPAIASSIGEYVGFLKGDLSIAPIIASLFLAIFCLISLFNLSLGVMFAIVLTIMAILELLIYQGGVLTQFRFSGLLENTNGSYDIISLMHALPFAIWMFLAIEGLSLFSVNIKKEDFRRTISRGYFSAFWTLVLLGVGVLFLAGSGIKWNPANFKLITNDNHPMPASLGLILSGKHILVKVFTFLGLFGLIASLQGVTLASTSQLEQLCNLKFLNQKKGRGIASILIFSASMLAIWSSQTSFLIELSVLGAVCMYLGVSIALIVLRFRASTVYMETSKIAVKEINYSHRDFSGKRYKILPYFAVLGSLLCLITLVILQPLATISLVLIGCAIPLKGVFQKVPGFISKKR